jgi:DNA polymerase-3 subunit beta
VKFTVQRFALSHVANAAAAVVPARAVRPVLANFLVSVAPGMLRVTATDLDLAVVASTGAVAAKEEATFLLPAARLVAILKEASEGDLTVQVDSSRAKVTSAGSQWDLTLHSDLLPEYPETPDPDKLTFADVNKAELLTAIKSVRHAVGRDVGRLALAGVSIVRNGDGTAKVTGCDSARFQQAHLSSFPFTASIPAIGSPSAMDELIRVLTLYPDVETAQAAQDGEDTLVFKVGSICFSTGRLVARPMDVETLLLAPAMDNKQELTVSRDDLKGVIRRVQIAADPESHAIGLRLSPGTLTVFARDKFRNEATESLPVEYDGQARTLVVHYGFLNDMLDAHPSPACKFRLGSDTARKKSMVLLRDDKTQLTGVIQQLHPKSLGLD